MNANRVTCVSIRLAPTPRLAAGAKLCRECVDTTPNCHHSARFQGCAAAYGRDDGAAAYGRRAATERTAGAAYDPRLTGVRVTALVNRLAPVQVAPRR